MLVSVAPELAGHNHARLRLLTPRRQVIASHRFLAANLRRTVPLFASPAYVALLKVIQQPAASMP